VNIFKLSNNKVDEMASWQNNLVTPLLVPKNPILKQGQPKVNGIYLVIEVKGVNIFKLSNYKVDEMAS
jgi:hypothetical protein